MVSPDDGRVSIGPRFKIVSVTKAPDILLSFIYDVLKELFEKFKNGAFVIRYKFITLLEQTRNPPLFRSATMVGISSLLY